MSFGDDTSKSAIPSTKPYLIRALHEWCVDFNFTPYLSVFVDGSVQVPLEYVKKDEIVLNISPSSCQDLQIDNEWIMFKARFNGISRDIQIPITHVMAIYSKENSQGMSFPVNIPELNTGLNVKTKKTNSDTSDTTAKPKSHLKLVK